MGKKYTRSPGGHNKPASIDELISKWDSEHSKSTVEDLLEGGNPWTMDPKRLLDYINTLSRYKFSTYMHFKSPVRFRAILENWIDNFSDRDKFMAFKLCSRVLFITSHEIEYLQRYVYNKFLSRLGMSRLISLDEFLFVSLEEDVKLADFFTLNEVGGRKNKSKGARNYLDGIDELIGPIKKIEKIRDEIDKLKLNTIPSIFVKQMEETIIQLQADIQKKAKEFESKKYLVLLTDFCGSGKTVTNDILRVINNYNFKSVFLLSYIICEDTINELSKMGKKSDKLEIVYGLFLDSKVNCLKEGSIIFSKSERDNIWHLCDQYFPKLEGHPDVKTSGDEVKYGYRRTGILLVLHRNCPNNTLPVIWAENEDWNGLFSRTESY